MHSSTSPLPFLKLKGDDHVTLDLWATCGTNRVASLHVSLTWDRLNSLSTWHSQASYIDSLFLIPHKHWHGSLIPPGYSNEESGENWILVLEYQLLRFCFQFDLGSAKSMQ